MNEHYIFKSDRLGFRNWRDKDIVEFAELNADEHVMEHFPMLLTIKETEAMVARFRKHQDERGYCYFATEVLETGEFIGFIGLAHQDYESEFNPSDEIGWRLKKSVWGKGYATEGAKRCLEYAFAELKMDTVVATCTIKNTKSENVMVKIGMLKKGTFNHPKLKEYPAYEKSMWYEIKNPERQKSVS